MGAARRLVAVAMALALVADAAAQAPPQPPYDLHQRWNLDDGNGTITGINAGVITAGHCP